jgi:Flp pilus assembly pilin Flp
MKMLYLFKTFRNDEDGAVTVDFVVLTAAIVILGLVVGTVISDGAEGLAVKIDNSLDDQGVVLESATSTAITGG